MNLFYSLPEDVLRIIYRILYNGVVHELNHRPGNFVSFYDHHSCWVCCVPHIEKLSKVYEITEQFKPDSWTFLKNNKYLFYYVRDHDTNLLKCIRECFRDNFSPFCWKTTYTQYMQSMQEIAKYGWEHFRQQTITRSKYIETCYWP